MLTLGLTLNGLAQWASRVWGVYAGMAPDPGLGSRRASVWGTRPLPHRHHTLWTILLLLDPDCWLCGFCPLAPEPQAPHPSLVSTYIPSRAYLFPGLQSCQPTAHLRCPSSAQNPFSSSTSRGSPGCPVAPTHPWMGFTHPSSPPCLTRGDGTSPCKDTQDQALVGEGGICPRSQRPSTQVSNCAEQMS